MITHRSVIDLAAACQRGERIIDVRERHEYVGGHVPRAEHLPMGRVPLRADDLADGRPVWVICETGNRSIEVVDYLSRRGIPAVNVQGGTSAWRSVGLPVRRANDEALSLVG